MVQFPLFLSPSFYSLFSVAQVCVLFYHLSLWGLLCLDETDRTFPLFVVPVVGQMGGTNHVCTLPVLLMQFRVITGLHGGFMAGQFQPAQLAWLTLVT